MVGYAVRVKQPAAGQHGEGLTLSSREGCWLIGVGAAAGIRKLWRDAYSAVNSVSCIPSGAWTRVLRSPHGVMTGGANGLALSDYMRAEQVELDFPGDVGDARLAGLAGGEVTGFLGLAGAGPVRAVP